MRDGYSLNSMGRGPIGNRRGLWQDLKPVPPWVFRKAKRGQTLDLSNLVPLENEPEGSAAATRGPPPLDSVESDSVPDLPGQIWSRVNVRLDRNQGGQGHAQETVHARRDHSTSADSRAGDQQRARRVDACRKLGITEQSCGMSC